MNYVIEEEDFYSASRAVSVAGKPSSFRASHSWTGNNVVIGVVLLGLAAVDGFFHYKADTLDGSSVLPLGVLVLLAYVAIMSPIRYKRCLKRFYHSLEFAGQTFQLEWNGSEIKTSTDTSSTVVQWKGLKSYVDTQNSFILILNGANFYVFPKRCFQGSELEEFGALLGEHVQPQHAGRR